MFGGHNNQNQQDSRNTNRETNIAIGKSAHKASLNGNLCGTLLTILAISRGYKYLGYILFDISLTLEDEASTYRRRGGGTPANHRGQ